ncbi:hypothetical protein PUN28_015255 [Cardiocondyla obscurior]|uniref:Uncharacterized protein n=1 Tax=Cardiocondyla obscurior TaxID=286306 RepID=A0AAW2F1R7_9HYME
MSQEWDHSVQRGDQAQRRHTQWLSEPPPMRRPGRRRPAGQPADQQLGRRTRDAVTSGTTERLESRAAGRPPPRAPTAPRLHPRLDHARLGQLCHHQSRGRALPTGTGTPAASGAINCGAVTVATPARSR